MVILQPVHSAREKDGLSKTEETGTAVSSVRVSGADQFQAGSLAAAAIRIRDVMVLALAPWEIR